MRYGKTFAMILYSSFFGTSIVCKTEKDKQRIIEIAKINKIQIPEPIIP